MNTPQPQPHPTAPTHRPTDWPSFGPTCRAEPAPLRPARTTAAAPYATGGEGGAGTGIPTLDRPTAAAPDALVCAPPRPEWDLSRLSLVAEHIHDAVIITDPVGRILWVNHAFTLLTEYPLEEVVGLFPGRLLQAPGNDPALIARVRAAIRGGTRAQAELLNRSRSGRPYWIELDIAPVRAADGRLTEFIGITRDITEKRRQREELASAHAVIEHWATHDALTGLPNRRYLSEFLVSAMQRAAHRRHPLGVCHIDLDNFKGINDTLGHAAGDHVLQHCARVMRQVVGPADFVARVGGDEFLVVCPEALTPESLEALGGRLVAELARPVEIAGSACRIGASVGVACSGAEDLDPERLLVHADIALYDAKNAGRGRVGLFSPLIGQRIAERRRIASELRTALERNELEPFFQPQIALATGTVIGFETLVRWRHPREGVLEPTAFLDVAEETGMISEIDRAMMEQGLDALLAMRAAGHAVSRISINVSAGSLRDETRIDQLKWAIDSRGLVPSDVVIEVLETTLIADENDQAARNIDRFAQAGFRVELDDFGTGYAALANLARLNIHALKIDRSLIGPMTVQKSSEVIVRAIIALAQQLDIAVLAEGVEGPADIAQLRVLGCQMGQGFGIARPMALSETIAWLDRRGRCGLPLPQARRMRLA